MKKKYRVMVLIIFLFSFLVSGIPITPKAFAIANGIADHLILGVTSSESAHSLATGGASTGISVDTAKVGAITESYTCRWVNNTGYFTANLAITANQPLTIQLREVRPNPLWGYSYGFEVYLNNILVYKRDNNNNTDVGAMPYYSSFFTTNDPAIVGTSSVTMKIISTGANAAYFTDVWAYTKISDYITAQNMRTPMRILPVVGSSKSLTTDLQTKITFIKTNLHTNSNVSLGFSILDFFLYDWPTNTQARSSTNTAAKYDSYLNLAKTNSLPVSFHLTSD